MKIIKELFKNMNLFSKKVFIFGIIIGALFYSAAAALYLTAGIHGDYYSFMRISADFAECAKELLSATLVPALLIDILHKADKVKDNR